MLLTPHQWRQIEKLCESMHLCCTVHARGKNKPTLQLGSPPIVVTLYPSSLSLSYRVGGREARALSDCHYFSPAAICSKMEEGFSNWGLSDPHMEAGKPMQDYVAHQILVQGQIRSLVFIIYCSNSLILRNSS